MLYNKQQVGWMLCNKQNIVQMLYNKQNTVQMLYNKQQVVWMLDNKHLQYIILTGLTVCLCPINVKKGWKNQAQIFRGNSLEPREGL